MKRLKFDAYPNICGIAYNPVSIARHITAALSSQRVDEGELIPVGSMFVHPHFHSIFNRAEARQTAISINHALELYRRQLLNAEAIFLTFGTSIGYRYKPTGEVVNNCHRIPAAGFEKNQLEVEESYDHIWNALKTLRQFNPNAQLYITVSPIRHLRHGAAENLRSKARLILLCEKLEKTLENCTYLPVYELINDELRDYRFYRQDDLIHLNDLGTGIVREKIRSHLISPAEYPLMERIERWNAMSDHNIQNPGSAEAEDFRRRLAAETIALNKILPGRFNPG